MVDVVTPAGDDDRDEQDDRRERCPPPACDRLDEEHGAEERRRDTCRDAACRRETREPEPSHGERRQETEPEHGRDIQEPDATRADALGWLIAPRERAQPRAIGTISAITIAMASVAPAGLGVARRPAIGSARIAIATTDKPSSRAYE